MSLSWPLTSVASLPTDSDSLRSLFALSLALALGAHAALFLRVHVDDVFTHAAPSCALALAGLFLAARGYALTAAAVAWAAIVVEQIPHPSLARVRRWSALAGSVAIITVWSYPQLRATSRVMLIPIGTVVPHEGTPSRPTPGVSVRDEFSHVLRRIMQAAPYNPPGMRAPLDHPMSVAISRPLRPPAVRRLTKSRLRTSSSRPGHTSCK